MSQISYLTWQSNKLSKDKKIELSVNNFSTGIFILIVIFQVAVHAKPYYTHVWKEIHIPRQTKYFCNLH